MAVRSFFHAVPYTNAGNDPILLGSGRCANNAEFAIVIDGATAACSEVVPVLENGHIQNVRPRFGMNDSGLCSDDLLQQHSMLQFVVAYEVWWNISYRLDTPTSTN